MDAVAAARKGTLVRDLLIFQLKLVLDGVKGVALFQISLFAAIFDLLFGRPGRPLVFYNVLRLSEKIDLWLNLYGASKHAEENDDGLFGTSRAGDDTMLGKLEELMRDEPEARRPASAPGAAV
jgi:hypothetical protein